MYLRMMFKMIFSVVPLQVENERDFSISSVFSQAQRSALTVNNISTLTFINKNIVIHEAAITESPSDTDINAMEEFLNRTKDIDPDSDGKSVS